MFKVCRKCGFSRDLSEFHKRAQAPDGLHPHCKPCVKITSHEAYSRMTKAEVSAKTTAWILAHPERYRNATLKRQYGISLCEYESMLIAQDGRCAICRKPPIGKRLAVDHNHTTGSVRGLLCSLCNRGIGHFKDDVDLMASAISYLRGCTE